VVDDRALVVCAEQHQGAIQVDEIVVVETGYLPVRNALAVSDHAPELALHREDLRHAARI